jgi:hypothetical protein
MVGSFLVPTRTGGGSGVLAGDPGGEDAVGVVGEVVADQGVEALLVLVVVAVVAARVRSSPPSSPTSTAATSAAATSTVGALPVRARAWTRARASASPAISRLTSWWMSSDMAGTVARCADDALTAT